MVYGCNIPTKYGFWAIFKKDNEYEMGEIQNIILDMGETLKVFYNTSEKRVYNEKEILFSHEDKSAIEQIYNNLKNNIILESEISLNSYGMFGLFAIK